MSIRFMILGKGNEIHFWLISAPQFIESYPLRALNDPLLDHSLVTNGAIIHWTGAEEIRADGSSKPHRNVQVFFD